MKKISIYTFASMALFFIYSCSSPVNNENSGSAKDSTAVASTFYDSLGSNFFTVTLKPLTTSFKKPGLQSFASAMYNGYWILIGGQKVGFHGTSNNPTPFKSTGANDSIWVIDIAGGRSWSVQVPAIYASYLSASNPAYYQAGGTLYFCGGFTAKSGSSKNFDFTSDRFFQIDLASLVQYVQTGGAQPALGQVIPMVIQNPYVQVTGGEMFISGAYFYIVGGQNYSQVYASGITGAYTNSIRRFMLHQSGSNWVIGDTVSYVDPVNLHRRDFNLSPIIVNGKVSATIYGGVFTPKDMAYQNPVYVKGWETGTVSISPSSTLMNANQYTCATLPIWINAQNPSFVSFLGGISYEMYDTVSKSIVVGDHGMPLPFSNLISIVTTDGATYSTENIQTPPAAPLMPTYLGANATFFPVSQYLVTDVPYNNTIIDIKKVFPTSGSPPVVVGYMYGGILSMGPTSGTTPHGHVNTYGNPVIYQVVLTYTGSSKK